MATIKQFEEVIERLDRNIGIGLRSRLVAELVNKYVLKEKYDNSDSQMYSELSFLQYLDDDIKELKRIWEELKGTSRIVNNLIKINIEDLMRIMN